MSGDFREKGAPATAAGDGLARDRTFSLVLVCILAAACLTLALVGATPSSVSATEALGQSRSPGEAAFVASHRGASAVAPENTIPAVTAALDEGFPYVEVDLALTADGHPVLMHDPTVDRTTDGSGEIANLTFDQVRRLDAGAWFSPAFAGTQVPSIDDLCAVLAGREGRVLLDLKGEWTEASMATMLETITAFGLERRVTLASFDAGVLALAAAHSEVVARLLLIRDIPTDIVRAAEEAGARGIIVGRAVVMNQPDVVAELHRAGLRIMVYTLNRDTQWREVTELGVDGIITDDPAALSEWLQDTVSTP